MSPKIHSKLPWMLLVFLVGCQDQGNSDEYFKLADMESGGESACRMSWFLASGWDAGFVKGGGESDNDPIAPLDTPHETRPGVVSTFGARLSSVGVLDTSPDAEPPPCEKSGSGRRWGANLTVMRDKQASTQGCPLAPSAPSVDGGVSETTIDLSGYSGLVFWAKAARTRYPWPPDAGEPNHTMETRIRILIQDWFSTPGGGGHCEASNCIKDTTNKCWNSFSATFDLTESFSRYEVDFSTLWRDPTWGKKPEPYRPDLEHVYFIAFQVDAAKCAADPNAVCVQGYPPLAFDFWIDDVYLVKRSK